MNDETVTRILGLLDVISVEVAANGSEIRGIDAKFTQKLDGLDAKFNGLDAKFNALDAKVTSGFERVERRLGRLEIRIEDVETEARLFRTEFERRVAPLERRRPN